MTVRKQAWRGMGTVGTAQALSQALGLVRNIVIARVLSPTDVGVAASLAVTLALVELLSDVSTDKVLIQSSKGNEPVMQRTAQGVMVVRGVSQCVLLLALAWPVAWMFDVPGAWWAFACVAAVPLIKGFVNLDPVRRQRELHYGASTAADLFPQVLATAAAWPLAWWLDSYAAVVCLTIGQSIFYVLLTHVLSTRPYGLSWDRESLRTLTTFAIPLFFNGVLLFATMQGDRAIIGTAYSVETLGVYWVTTVLIGAPAAMLAKTAIAIGLPMLSRVQDSSGLFEKRYAMCVEWLCVMAALLAVVVMLAGDRLVTMVYGAKYAEAKEYVAFVGAFNAVWIVRIAPTLAAMARGDTKNALVANIVRTLALVGVLGVALAGAELKWVVVCAVAGEVAATIVSTMRLNAKHGVPTGLTTRPAMLVVLAVLGCAAADMAWGLGHGIVETGMVVAGACVGVIVAASAVCPNLRDELLRGVRAVRGFRRTVRV